MQANTARLIDLLNASIDARFNAAKSEENDNQMKFFFKLKTAYAGQTSFAASIEKAHKNGVNYQTVKGAFAMVACTDKKAKEGYLAQYAAEKVCKMIRSQDDISKLDPYSAAIVANALFQSGKLSAKGALRALCNKIELDVLDEQDIIKYCAKVEVTTASTQRSSTREALRVLGLATCAKGKKGDPVELTENGKQFFAFLIA